MKMNKILIAGATGFIGQQMISSLLEKGYFVNALSRKPRRSSKPQLHYFQWDTDTGFIDKIAFEEVDVIINLTGANIGEQRWSNRRKKEIVDSRITSINLLYNFVKHNNIQIKTFISSSAVGYYGTVTSDNIFTEESAAGKDFLAEVCQSWEQAAMQFQNLGIRTVILRKGVIIGIDGGMLQKLSPLARLGINVSLGSGKQFLPWMDVRDVIRLYDFILANNEISGIYNAVSSEHITMNEFSRILLQSFGKKSWLPNTPAFIIKMIFGEMSVMLLEGSKVSNEKLLSTGFTFELDTLKKSLESSM